MTGTKHIAIHKHGEEGGLHIDATSGLITTPNEERPLWANGYAVADLADYRQWVSSRFGDGAPDHLKAPQLLEVGMFAWVGIDEEGDEVEIQADDTVRTSELATALGLDTSADNFEKELEGTLKQLMIEHDMTINPTTEASLKDAEGLSFEDAQKEASNG